MTVNIQVELTDDEAWSLAQLCKRFGHSDAKLNASSTDETYLMLYAMDKVRKSLAENGLAPR